MKKRWAAAILAGLLVFGVCGCERQPAETPEPTPAETQTAAPTPNPTVERDVLEVYQEALERLLVEHIHPGDGEYEVAVGEYGDVDQIEEMEFAIEDIDLDGNLELLIRNAVGRMASQHTNAYRYDTEKGELVAEFGGTASCRFYDNGTAQDDLSHNQGYSKRFWPFVAYEYNTQAKEYQKIQLIDAWELEYMKEIGLESNYPAEVDEEGAGFVYYSWDDETTKMSQKEYDAWYDSIFGGAEEIEVNYQPLTQENIEKVCARTAYERFLAGDMSLLEPEWQEGLLLWQNVYLLEGELEYTYLDLDGDGVEELLLQWINEPGEYNGVFHYAGGRLYVWQHDAVERVCWDHPLQDGTMVTEYHLSGNYSYALFRYQSDGSREQVASLYSRSQWADGSGAMMTYEVDGREVSQSEFEREVKRLVKDQMLDYEAWTVLPAQPGPGK